MRYRIISVTAFQQNCSLIWCETTGMAALIDPGGDYKLLLETMEQEGVTLAMVLLTHGHLDHVGAANEFATRYGIPIIGPHKDDEFWLQGLPQQAETFGLPSIEPFTPHRWLQDGEQLSLGNQQLTVLHTPGHTPGHVVFYNAPEQLVFVGDVLFRGSIGRSDFPRGDHDTLLASIRDKLLPLGDGVTFIPGHGPIGTLGEERLHNPFLNE